ncbi:MAG: DEAD/DEAH box helicase [Candidatus Loosdrechtia sp.]|uniref:DEAD/DEAH box helicase n=1 Tax=Candidatus Loosdrechtia sp. TaxID=3101272 RepID=UPI003A6DB8A4|nr:MAG: SNF2-related protein [Candidatus Jettenia sp. AMX2]
MKVLDIAGIPVSFSNTVTIENLNYDSPYESYRSFKLNYEAHKLALHPAFDTLFSLNLARGIIPLDHQVNSVKKLLSRFRGRGMLCDEVGLGKTIEACLAMLELITRGLAKRVLILVPSSLIEQWKEETFFKFNLEFITSDDKRFKDCGTDAWDNFDRIIASIHTAKKMPHSNAILQQNFDLIIVDEAHHMKNANTVGWKFLNALRKKYIFLLTATPVHNNLEELFNLVTLVYPGELGTLKSFKRNYISSRDRLTPKNYESLKSLLSELIIRNRRATSDVKFTKRHARTIQIPMNEAERTFYESVSGLIKNQYNGSRQQIRMTLRILQEEIGSVPAAAASTLKSLKDKLPDNIILKNLIEQCNSITFPEKLRTLIDVVSKLTDKVIVFTKFRPSHALIAETLKKYDIPYSPLHGGMTRIEKESSIRKFQKETKVLIATDVGSEGRNLQFCNNIINFDLPWNPMRIEQRIGRISRIGQEKDVHILNLSAKGTIEDYILYLLDAKINMFELVIGEVDVILGKLDEESEFEELILDAWTKSANTAQFENKIHVLGENLLSARQKYFTLKDTEDKIFGDQYTTAVAEESPPEEEENEHVSI